MDTPRWRQLVRSQCQPRPESRLSGHPDPGRGSRRDSRQPTCRQPDVPKAPAGGVEGWVRGNRVELKSGLEVISFNNSDQYPNYDQVIDFSSLVATTDEYIEDNFRIQAINNLTTVTETAIIGSVPRS